MYAIEVCESLAPPPTPWLDVNHVDALVFMNSRGETYSPRMINAFNDLSGMYECFVGFSGRAVTNDEIIDDAAMIASICNLVGYNQRKPVIYRWAPNEAVSDADVVNGVMRMYISLMPMRLCPILTESQINAMPDELAGNTSFILDKPGSIDGDVFKSFGWLCQDRLTVGKIFTRGYQIYPSILF